MFFQANCDEFWDFVRLSPQCGAFDDEKSFNTFQAIYDEYEQFLNDPYGISNGISPQFQELLDEVRETLKSHADFVRSSPSDKHLYQIFKDTDVWNPKFTKVAAFKRLLDSKLIVSILSPFSRSF